jgi:thiosulfate/3-mercaptopyruvate sulfurtransferase
MRALVSPAETRAARSTDHVIFDATYYLPNEGLDARGLYQAAHLPGARFFDIDAVSDASSGLPHMLPRPEDFARIAAAEGVGDATEVLVYDQRGIFSAARVWWMFRVFGHDAVSVLDGGLPAWIAAGGTVETGAAAPASPARFTPRFRSEMVWSLADVTDNLRDGYTMILDARAAGRFDGTVPEPRAGMRGGHIPGALNLPFTEVLQDGRLRPPEALRARFRALGIDGSRPVVTSCGSGVTAAVLNLAMVTAGLPEPALYDGSWSEWGGRADTPIEV